METREEEQQWAHKAPVGRWGGGVWCAVWAEGRLTRGQKWGWGSGACLCGVGGGGVGVLAGWRITEPLQQCNEWNGLPTEVGKVKWGRRWVGGCHGANLKTARYTTTVHQRPNELLVISKGHRRTENVSLKVVQLEPKKWCVCVCGGVNQR